MTGAVRLCAVVLLGALAGCGKSAHQRLIDDANRICREGDRQIMALPRATDRRSLASTADRQAAIIERARRRLAGLEASPADRRGLARYLAALDVTARTTRAIALAAVAGRPARLQALSVQARRDSLTARRAARDLGPSRCGRSPR